ncbi:hypothetical protein CXG81DRAFT_20335 [Caulochytrium protostelioides]|uniref:Non-structural maintenance of chromosomes element 4 n=1 Tax=Caulochytrium protostelioides TaxID=1555241 RepID=A0A4P9X3J4_9FUNG|nr:hypothetical protein CXG81DRAFT_20335 [Caulochytrium protostelioides]|eukprot:RKO99603.1 hypothetical protein CXG81DRAFT_20335 [Caulochytrium protostelioides]
MMQQERPREAEHTTEVDADADLASQTLSDADMPVPQRPHPTDAPLQAEALDVQVSEDEDEDEDEEALEAQRLAELRRQGALVATQISDLATQVATEHETLVMPGNARLETYFSANEHIRTSNPDVSATDDAAGADSKLFRQLSALNRERTSRIALETAAFRVDAFLDHVQRHVGPVAARGRRAASLDWAALGRAHAAALFPQFPPQRFLLGALRAEARPRAPPVRTPKPTADAAPSETARPLDHAPPDAADASTVLQTRAFMARIRRGGRRRRPARRQPRQRASGSDAASSDAASSDDEEPTTPPRAPFEEIVVDPASYKNTVSNLFVLSQVVTKGAVGVVAAPDSDQHFQLLDLNHPPEEVDYGVGDAVPAQEHQTVFELNKARYQVNDHKTAGMLTRRFLRPCHGQR